ncbi:MAG TPA: TIGR02594 family protein [Hanamia sp.]|nr:TIGR02594 family protein [Hanamia sp.]
MQNNYKYQGTFSEMDADIGWNDFELRNYDAQVGRWVQQDPFDEFASGYVGLGADPINGIDPSGGISINFGTIGAITGSIALDRLLVSAGSAAVGFAVDKLAGGNGWAGAAVGAGVGLGATFIPPFSIENLASLGKSAVPSMLEHVATMADDIVMQKNIISSIDRITSTPPNLLKNLPQAPKESEPNSDQNQMHSDLPWVITEKGELFKGEAYKITIMKKGKPTKEGCNCGVDVENYLRAVGLGKGQPWCAAFLNWDLKKNHMRGTGLGSAKSFETWGQKLDRPAYGSIGVIEHPDGTGHVTTIVGQSYDKNYLIGLGGNQGDKVQYSKFLRGSFKTFRYPAGEVPNYNLPLMNIKGGVPSDR